MKESYMRKLKADEVLTLKKLKATLIYSNFGETFYEDTVETALVRSFKELKAGAASIGELAENVYFGDNQYFYQLSEGYYLLTVDMEYAGTVKELMEGKRRTLTTKPVFALLKLTD